MTKGSLRSLVCLKLAIGMASLAAFQPCADAHETAVTETSTSRAQSPASGPVQIQAPGASALFLSKSHEAAAIIQADFGPDWESQQNARNEYFTLLRHFANSLGEQNKRALHAEIERAVAAQNDHNFALWQEDAAKRAQLQPYRDRMDAAFKALRAIEPNAFHAIFAAGEQPSSEAQKNFLAAYNEFMAQLEKASLHPRTRDGLAHEASRELQDMVGVEALRRERTDRGHKFVMGAGATGRDVATAVAATGAQKFAKGKYSRSALAGLTGGAVADLGRSGAHGRANVDASGSPLDKTLDYFVGAGEYYDAQPTIPTSVQAAGVAVTATAVGDLLRKLPPPIAANFAIAIPSGVLGVATKFTWDEFKAANGFEAKVRVLDEQTAFAAVVRDELILRLGIAKRDANLQGIYDLTAELKQSDRFIQELGRLRAEADKARRIANDTKWISTAETALAALLTANGTLKALKPQPVKVSAPAPVEAPMAPGTDDMHPYGGPLERKRPPGATPMGGAPASPDTPAQRAAREAEHAYREKFRSERHLRDERVAQEFRARSREADYEMPKFRDGDVQYVDPEFVGWHRQSVERVANAKIPADAKGANQAVDDLFRQHAQSRQDFAEAQLGRDSRAGHGADPAIFGRIREVPVKDDLAYWENGKISPSGTEVQTAYRESLAKRFLRRSRLIKGNGGEQRNLEQRALDENGNLVATNRIKMYGANGKIISITPGGDEVAKLFASARRSAAKATAETTQAGKLEYFARSAYLYFQTMPYERGSAAIGRSFYEGLGRRLFGPGFKLSPDIDTEAMTRAFRATPEDSDGFVQLIEAGIPN